MDEFSMLLLNGDLEGAREFHRKKVEESFNNGVFVGKGAVRDAIAKTLGFKTGKE